MQSPGSGRALGRGEQRASADQALRPADQVDGRSLPKAGAPSSAARAAAGGSERNGLVFARRLGMERLHEYFTVPASRAPRQGWRSPDSAAKPAAATKRKRANSHATLRAPADRESRARRRDPTHANEAAGADIDEDPRRRRPGPGSDAIIGTSRSTMAEPNDRMGGGGHARPVEKRDRTGGGRGSRRPEESQSRTRLNCSNSGRRGRSEDGGGAAISQGRDEVGLHAGLVHA